MAALGVVPEPLNGPRLVRERAREELSRGRRLGYAHAMRLAIAIALLCAACGEDQEPERARALYERLQAEDYRSWARAPGFAERQESRAPHGDSVDIFVNDVVETDLASVDRLEQWSEGAVIVKDGYEGGDLCFVAVLSKEDGQWFWAEYNGDGDTLYSGAPELCTSCHALGDDSVRALFLP